MWDERFNQPEYVYGKLPNDFLNEHWCSLPQGNILSLGEGEGRNAVFLAEKGYNVVALDASSVGLKKAEKLAADRGTSIKILHTDLENYQITANCWWGIISIFCHLPPDLRKNVHKQIVEGLLPGGIYLTEAYTPAQIGKNTGGPKIPELMVTAEILRQELSSLEILHCLEIDRNIKEGPLHSGIGSVVQFIGKKK